MKEKLKYKIKNGPRVESVNEFILSDGTRVAMFQGFRGSYPDLDFIVKYKEPENRLRTPSHTHWIVDLLVKSEFNKELVRNFVQKYIDLYDIMTPFETQEERNNYQLQYVGESLTDFQGIDGCGYLSIEFLSSILELFILCEKRSDDAFMFKSLLQLVVDFCDGKRDYYQVVGYSKRV